MKNDSTPAGVPHERLIEHWRICGLTIASPAPADVVSQFESTHQVRLPPDLRNYFLHVDGMVQSGYDSEDQNGFAFLPISQLKDLFQIGQDDGLIFPGLEPRNYFVFIIYMQWCWAYAVDLGLSSTTWGQIVRVGTVSPKVVARSFAEFVSLYLSDSPILYSQ